MDATWLVFGVSTLAILVYAQYVVARALMDRVNVLGERLRKIELNAAEHDSANWWKGE